MKPLHKPLNAKGLTMYEILISVTIFALVAVAVMTYFTTLWQGSEASQVKSDSHTQAALALQVMTMDIRHGTTSDVGSPPNLLIPAPPGNTQLTLYKPADLDNDGDIVDNTGAIEWDSANPIVFQFDAGANQIQRVEGAEVRVLANDVTSLTFDDQSSDATLSANEVRITLQVGKQTTRGLEYQADVSGIVQVRN